MLTCDPQLLDRLWLADYPPEVIATEARRYPPLSLLAVALGGRTTSIIVPIPGSLLDRLSGGRRNGS